ncbi:hypothetical protein Fcan01_16048 [Folsomia candida]|uniref:Uncharacterized protein n=1 Tax=Folsomia candida TaxID=158441 RepID=A0A226DVA2_FOLCA|nr:hypothetical protein Fcan01_16048 [Folsomia candida]
MANQTTFVLLIVLVSKFCGSVPLLRGYSDPVFLDAEIKRVRGGNFNVSQVAPMEGGISDTKISKVPVDMEGSGQGSGEEGDDSTSEELDVTCAPGKGWHVRGQRCVPVDCPGGINKRYFNTGECMHAPAIPPMASHVYPSHPGVRPLSKGMRAFLRRRG